MINRQLLTFALVVVFGLAAAAQELPRIELGVQYSGIGIPSDRVGCGGCNVFNSGIGGRFVVNFTRVFSFDSEFDFAPDEGSGATNVDGGRVMIGLFGLKGGHRFKRFGVFGKVRPGFQTYGHVITSVASTNPLEFNFGHRVNFALDMGGVVEYYATRRFALRFDYGDTRIRFGTGAGHFWRNNLQVGTGVLFRF